MSGPPGIPGPTASDSNVQDPTVIATKVKTGIGVLQEVRTHFVLYSQSQGLTKIKFIATGLPSRKGCDDYGNRGLDDYAHHRVQLPALLFCFYE
jgi:hypothetical protein